jgi:hypothetical protein
MKMGLEQAKAMLEKYQTLLVAIPDVVGPGIGVCVGASPRRFFIKVQLSRPISRGSLLGHMIPMEIEDISMEKAEHSRLDGLCITSPAIEDGCHCHNPIYFEKPNILVQIIF